MANGAPPSAKLRANGGGGEKGERRGKRSMQPWGQPRGERRKKERKRKHWRAWPPKGVSLFSVEDSARWAFFGGSAHSSVQAQRYHNNNATEHTTRKSLVDIFISKVNPRRHYCILKRGERLRGMETMWAFSNRYHHQVS